MSTRPIFMVTHPRACSTAFERVFMTRRDILDTVHEPFGDAFYFGPERLSERFEDDEAWRNQSGFSNTTYKDVMDQLRAKEDANEGKRVFIKDIAYYLFSPDGKPSQPAPSLCEGLSNGHSTNGTTSGADGVNGTNGTSHTNGANGLNGVNGTAERRNPTVIPVDMLRPFHFTFLIRHPQYSIPSYYRCCIPPLDQVTKFTHFMPNEAGYDELRRLFDFLRHEGIVGPPKAGDEADGVRNGDKSGVTITVIDADDLLDHPDRVIEAYCRETGIDFNHEMLRWEDSDNQDYAVRAFEKWQGFHDDVIGSTSLQPRSHKHKTSISQSGDEEWREKYGEEAQKVIRETVDANIPHYEYLKSFALKF